MHQEDAGEAVCRAARQGAKSVTTRRQVIADAVALTLEKWEDAVARGKVIEDPKCWAFRVGANAAKRLGKRLAPEELPEHTHDRLTKPSASRSPTPALRRRLRREIQRRGHELSGRQLEVAMKLCESGMSLHRAAAELGMDRSNLRRSFRSAVQRLTSVRILTPPSLLE